MKTQYHDLKENLNILVRYDDQLCVCLLSTELESGLR